MTGNRWKEALPLCFGLFLALTWVWACRPLMASASPDTLYVSPDGDDDYPCNSYANPCRTIQRALNMSVSGDEIRVSAGIYTHTSGTVAVINNTVELLGGWNSSFTTRDPAVYLTVMDAQRRGRVVEISGSYSPVLDGFTITGGNAHIETNHPGVGGGIYSYGGSPTIQNNVITNNVAYSGSTPWGHGGGIYISNASAAAVIEDNRVISNAASTTYPGLGGGLSIYNSSLKLLHNEIIQNVAGRGGGGIYVNDSDGLLLDANLILSNTIVVSPSLDSYGGGIYMEYTGPFTMTNNIIAHNDAPIQGGAVYVYGSNNPYNSFGVLINNTLVDNNFNNTGEGIYIIGKSSLSLANNIVVNHAYGLVAGSNSELSTRYTLFWGNDQDHDTVGSGVITSTAEITGSDPLFVNPAARDYHIMIDSPARNAGDPAGIPPAPLTDIDGDIRVCGRPDIGADEYYCPHYDIFLSLVRKN